MLKELSLDGGWLRLAVVLCVYVCMLSHSSHLSNSSGFFFFVKLSFQLLIEFGKGYHSDIKGIFLIQGMRPDSLKSVLNIEMTKIY